MTPASCRIRLGRNSALGRPQTRVRPSAAMGDLLARLHRPMRRARDRTAPSDGFRNLRGARSRARARPAARAAGLPRLSGPEGPGCRRPGEPVPGRPGTRADRRLESRHEPGRRRIRAIRARRADGGRTATGVPFQGGGPTRAAAIGERVDFAAVGIRQATRFAERLRVHAPLAPGRGGWADRGRAGRRPRGDIVAHRVVSAEGHRPGDPRRHRFPRRDRNALERLRRGHAGAQQRARVPCETRGAGPARGSARRPPRDRRAARAARRPLAAPAPWGPGPPPSASRRGRHRSPSATGRARGGPERCRPAPRRRCL